MSRFAVLVLAAGRSTRFGDAHYKKPMATLGGKAVWLHSVERFVNRADVCETIVVVSPDDREEFARKFGANLALLGVRLCEGGAERADSVRAGLAAIGAGTKDPTEDSTGGQATHVAVHDAARPLVADHDIDRVFEAAVADRAAILATPVTATLKQAIEHRIEATVPREGLWQAQTPQVFELELLRLAHGSAADVPLTDDAQAVERLGEPVTLVEGSPENLKITTKHDLRLAEAILAARPPTKPAGGNPFADDDLWR